MLRADRRRWKAVAVDRMEARWTCWAGRCHTVYRMTASDTGNWPDGCCTALHCTAQYCCSAALYVTVMYRAALPSTELSLAALHHAALNDGFTEGDVGCTGNWWRPVQCL